MNLGTARVIQADARNLPLADNSVDLCVTSPPYFALRSYQDNGQHYQGQVGDEPTPTEYVDSLIEVTRECIRVLKPSGSLFVNLGDKYSGAPSGPRQGMPDGATRKAEAHIFQTRRAVRHDIPQKSLMGIPWRYALRCIDDLGLILRAEVIWSKPNGLPESVTDRVRRSHEQWFHFVLQPRYYSAVDEIREPHTLTLPDGRPAPRARYGGVMPSEAAGKVSTSTPDRWSAASGSNALGKLPGSVWTIATEPLTVPDHLGVDHFACVDSETEILTPRGWLRHGDLRAGDVVAGYDLDHNDAVWTTCSDVHRYDYDGELVVVESRDVSMRLTPNHRTVVQRMRTKARLRGAVEVVRADELDRYHFIPRSVEWSAPGRSRFGTRLASLMGWVAAEGWYAGRRVYLSQSQDVNPHHVAAIDALLDEPLRTDRKRVYKGRPWTEVTWRLSAEQAAAIQRVMPDKRLPWSLVESSTDERRACLEAFIDGDGHRRPDGRIAIFQTVRHNLDVLQAVAVTLGYKTTIRQGPLRSVLYLTEGGRSTTLRGTSGLGSKVHRQHYRGTVWCPSTGTGTFIARRNGSVFVTGNSYPTELPRRIIQGWSPRGVCTVCNEGRRPVTEKERDASYALERGTAPTPTSAKAWGDASNHNSDRLYRITATITGYACGCPEPTAPTTPGLVLDPFGGTGTTALVARALGRDAITIDMSADYCRLAAWRTQDRDQLAKVLGVPKVDPPHPDDVPLFDLEPTQRSRPSGLDYANAKGRTCGTCGYRTQRPSGCEKCGGVDLLGGDVA